MQFVIIMALMLGVMYVLMIRPQRQKQAQQKSMIEDAGVGDDVLTTGGIYGTITQAEGDDVVVEIASGLNVHMTRRGIAAVLPPEQDEDEEDEADGEDEAEDSDADSDSDSDSDSELVAQADDSAHEGDEGAVTDEEEAVRSGAAHGSTGDGRG